jgi:hypothetical protein
MNESCQAVSADVGCGQPNKIRLFSTVNMHTPHDVPTAFGALCPGVGSFRRWVDTREIMGEINAMKRCMELFRDCNRDFSPAQADEFLHEAIKSHERLGAMLKELRPAGEMPENRPEPDEEQEYYDTEEDEWESDYQSQWGLYDDEASSN